MTDVLTLRNITKSFTQANGIDKLTILENVNLNIKKGKIVVLLGSSGSGKTTLLQIAGLVDKADSGEVNIDGIDMTDRSEKLALDIRKNKLGFIYQSHNLLREFTALENVMMPELLRGISRIIAKEKATDILSKLGLINRLNYKPSMLSGGEQQRVAIARAIIGNPSLILADEPTGSLDLGNANIVMNYFIELVRDLKISALIVTHSQQIAKCADVIVSIKNKQIL